MSAWTAVSTLVAMPWRHGRDRLEHLEDLEARVDREVRRGQRIVPAAIMSVDRLENASRRLLIAHDGSLSAGRRPA